MSLNRTKTWLFACGLQLMLVSAVHAQGTSNTEEDILPKSRDYQLFDRPDASNYGNGPKRQSGFFASWKAIEWAVNSPTTTAVGRDGFFPVWSDGLAFGIQENALDTGFITTRLRGGSAIELGFVNEGRGWMIGTTILNSNSQRATGQQGGVSFFSPFVNGVNALSSFVDVTGPAGVPDLFDDDLNGNNIYGRFGEDLGTPNANPPPAFVLPFDGIPDVPAPIDYGDTVQLPIYFDTINVLHRNSLWAIELMHIWQLPTRSMGGQWDFIGGVKYFRFRERFLVDALGDVIFDDAGIENIVGVLADSRWDTRADNNLVGPQVGLKWSRNNGRWSLSAQGRFTAAANFQQIRQDGYFANRATGTFNNNPLVPTLVVRPTPTSPPLLGTPFNIISSSFAHRTRATEFSPLVELKLDASYRLFRSMSVDLGFTYIYTDNIARPSSMVDYQLPSMGILEDNNRQDLQIFGVNAGASFNF